MRPVMRRWEVNDLETARKMVSDEERQALERAEQLRHEAEELLQAAQERSGIPPASEEPAEGEEPTELVELRNEVETLRARCAELEAKTAEPTSPEEGAPTGGLAPLATEGLPSGELLNSFAQRMSQDIERLMEEAGAAAARLHLQAEEDMTRAKEQSARILSMASKEAEDLLAAAVKAIERDTMGAQSAREQAERENEVAGAARQEAAGVLGQAQLDADQIREGAREESRRMLEEARDVSGRAVEEAQDESRRIVEEGHLAAREEARLLRRELADEVSKLRAAMNSASETLERFTTIEPDGAQPAGGEADPEAKDSEEPAPSNGTAAGQTADEEVRGWSG
ncbi:MAG: hypothetical protein JO337_05625 [Acidimicrobiales bacterium]|nr:hypothetical protein [Acidimicrobiales bacterium]